MQKPGTGKTMALENYLQIRRDTGGQNFRGVKIGVFGAFPGAGVSLIAGSLAYFAADPGPEKGDDGRGIQAATASPANRPYNPSVAELGTPYFYRALSFEKREGLYNFMSYTDALEKRSRLSDLENLNQRINWLIKKPDESPDPPEASKLYRFISRAPGDPVIFDCSGIFGEAALDLAAEMDVRIFVLDPMPTKLLAAYSYISGFLLEDPGAIVTVNKMNSGVPASELKLLLGRRRFITIPYIPAEIRYRAEFSSVLPAAAAPSDKIFAQIKQLIPNIL